MSKFFRRLIIFGFLIGFYTAKGQVTAGFTVQAATPDCNPAIYSFTNTSTGAAPLTYQWNFGVYPGVNSVLKDPSTTYLGCGAFTVQLIVTDAAGKKDTASQNVNINCSPRVNFEAASVSGCVPFQTTLKSTSTAGSGSIASYLWDFGDGFTGTLPSPPHTYQSAGCKNVTLVVTNSFGCASDTTINNIVCAIPNPLAAFTSTLNSSCSAPFTISYQDASSQGKAPYTYQWLFPGGTPASSSVDAPVVTYNTPGNFSATLIITDGNGCTDTLTKNNYISIADNKTDFTLSAAGGCIPSTISAQGSAAVVPQSWQWTVTPSAGIGTPQSQNTTLSFTAPGTYTVCLDADYGGGCLASKCDTVIIHPSPVVDFSSTGVLSTCKLPNPITYVNHSTGSNLTYKWLFDGGSPSSSNSATPPAITYSNCGEYSVSLEVTDNFGCSVIKEDTNYVNLTCPKASFSVSPRGGCTPLSSSFNSSASTGNPVSWLWVFGDPASGASDTSRLQNPSHTFNNNGCYTVTLITTNAEGCSGSSTVPDAVCAGNHPVASLNANPNITCANNPFQFINTSLGTDSTTTYQWDFMHKAPNFNSQSRQKNPSFVFGDTGTFNVSLIVSNFGCNDTVVMDDAVTAVGPVSIPKASSNCSGNLSITLDGTKSIDAQHYYWSIPGGTPSTDSTSVVTVTFPAPGTYSASLYVTSDSNTCTDIDSVKFQINLAKADFDGGPYAGCAPLRTCFNNTSVGSTGCNWVVRDEKGNLVTTNLSTNACFLLTNPGYYTVYLTIYNTLGCPDIKQEYVSVSQTVSGFNASSLSGCAPFTTQFNDSSSSVYSKIVKWKWNFGDSLSAANDSSLLQNPSHTYSLPGYYTVALTVTDTNGCSNTLTRNLYIHVTKPQAIFTTTDTAVCRGAQCCFVNNSSGTGLTYYWSFGDSTASNLQAPCHSYTKEGTYSIQLVVKDSSGCSDTATATNLVKVIEPKAAFTADTTKTTCPPLLVQFSNLSTNIDAGATYLWQFGDGQISTVPSPEHIYNVAGDFNITLIVTNSTGCSDTLIMPKYIYVGGPTAHISIPPTSGCVPHSTCMSAVSSTGSLTWNFGDGTVRPGNDTVCYTYNTPGTYYPELILNDGASCIYSLPVGKVTVTGVAANFIMSDSVLCQNGTVQFTDSSIGNAKIKYRTWNFGDPASGTNDTSSLVNPTHFYSTNGIYPVTLSISTEDNCTNSITKRINVSSKPPVNFSVNNTLICAPDTVFFLNGNQGAGLLSVWSFGDAASGASNTSVLANPSHYYSKPGTYEITLTVSLGGTCVDSLKRPVLVNSTPHITATPTQSSVCSGSSTTITANGANMFSWVPSMGLNADTGSVVKAIPLANATYTVTGIAASGCQDTAIVKVSVMPLPTVIAATTNPLVCKGSSTVLSASGALTYEWIPSNGLSSLSGANVSATPVAAITYTVTGTDASGCTSSATVALDTTSKPVLAVLPFDSILCAGGKATIVVNGADNYSWFPNTGLNSITGSTVISSPVASIVYTVIGTSGAGCSDTLSVPIKVNNPPTITATAVTSSVCSGDSTAITANGANTYYWTPGYGLNATSGSTVIAHPLTTTSYTVTGLALTGCSDTTVVTVSVRNLPRLRIAAADSLVCTGASTTLSASGASSYSWFPSNGLSSSTGSIVTAYPAGATTYTVTGYDSLGCVSSTAISLGILPKPVLSVLPYDSVICAGQTTALIVTGASSYSWTPVIGLSSPSDSLVITNPDTSVIYSVTGMNDYGCSDTIFVPVVVDAIPNVIIAPDTGICIGASAVLRVSGGDSYSWTPDNTLSSANIDNPIATPTLNTTYTVVVTGADGCSIIDSLIVDVHPNPVAVAGPDTTICQGNTVVLHATGGDYYSWNPNQYLSDSAIANPICAAGNNITYTVTVTNAYGCATQNKVQISVIDSFSIKANPAVILCFGDTAQLSATGWSSYVWSPRESLDSPFSANPRAWPDVTTTYTVTATDGVCFTRSDTTTVTVDPKPLLSVSANADIVYGQNIQLQATGDGTFYWSPPDFLSCTDCSDPTVVHPSRAMTYTITLTDAAGCRVEDTVHISLTCTDDVVYIPNAFTPNGDNKNDIFRIRTYGLKQLIAFRVFDRWGEMVFETSDVDTGWDGTYKGQPCFPAVYDWYLEGVCSNGQKITKQGNVILIR